MKVLLSIVAIAVFFRSADAYLCYACTAVDVELAKQPNGTFYPGGYDYIDIENHQKRVPWEDFYKGDDCEYTKGLKNVRQINCQYGCLKGHISTSGRHVRNKVSRTYRQCAHPLESEKDRKKYTWGSTLKRAGASDGIQVHYYYCNDSTDDKACNTATSNFVSQAWPVKIASLSIITAIVMHFR